MLSVGLSWGFISDCPTKLIRITPSRWIPQDHLGTYLCTLNPVFREKGRAKYLIVHRPKTSFANACILYPLFAIPLFRCPFISFQTRLAPLRRIEDDLIEHDPRPGTFVRMKKGDHFLKHPVTTSWLHEDNPHH